MVLYRENTMSEATDKFYNMQVNLIKGGRIYAEKVAVKNIWEKEDNVFLDLYFHRLNKSIVFDSVFVHDIIDLNRDKYYKDIHDFIKDFNAAKEVVLPLPVQEEKKKNNILGGIENDIVLLLFMSRVLGHKETLKDKIVCGYIARTVENAENLSEKYLNNYISSINPTVEDFYAALKNIKSKNPQQAQALLKEIVKICLSDGYLHYAEKMYLADIIQMLRVEGVKIPKDLI